MRHAWSSLLPDFRFIHLYTVYWLACKHHETAQAPMQEEKLKLPNTHGPHGNPPSTTHHLGCRMTYSGGRLSHSHVWQTDTQAHAMIKWREASSKMIQQDCLRGMLYRVVMIPMTLICIFRSLCACRGTFWLLHFSHVPGHLEMKGFINCKQWTNICKWQLIFNWLLFDKKIETGKSPLWITKQHGTHHNWQLFHDVHASRKPTAQPHISHFRSESDIVHVGVPLTKMQALICVE